MSSKYQEALKKSAAERRKRRVEKRARGGSVGLTQELGARDPDDYAAAARRDDLSPSDCVLIDALDDLPLAPETTRKRGRGDKKRTWRRGREPIDLDGRIPRDAIEFCELMSHVGCSLTEISSFLGIDRLTLYNHMRRDPSLKMAIEVGRVKGVIGLRRAQHKKAYQGNPQMLIWLGKQRLNQREKVEIKESLGEGKLALDKLSRDELELFKSLVRKARDRGADLDVDPDDDLGDGRGGES